MGIWPSGLAKEYMDTGPQNHKKLEKGAFKALGIDDWQGSIYIGSGFNSGVIEKKPKVNNGDIISFRVNMDARPRSRRIAVNETIIIDPSSDKKEDKRPYEWILDEKISLKWHWAMCLYYPNATARISFPNQSEAKFPQFFE